MTTDDTKYHVSFTRPVDGDISVAQVRAYLLHTGWRKAIERDGVELWQKGPRGEPPTPSAFLGAFPGEDPGGALAFAMQAIAREEKRWVADVLHSILDYDHAQRLAADYASGGLPFEVPALWDGVDEDTGAPVCVARERDDKSVCAWILPPGGHWQLHRGEGWNRTMSACVLALHAAAEHERGKAVDALGTAAAEKLRADAIEKRLTGILMSPRCAAGVLRGPDCGLPRPGSTHAKCACEDIPSRADRAADLLAVIDMEIDSLERAPGMWGGPHEQEGAMFLLVSHRQHLLRGDRSAREVRDAMLRFIEAICGEERSWTLAGMLRDAGAIDQLPRLLGDFARWVAREYPPIMTDSQGRNDGEPQ